MRLFWLAWGFAIALVVLAVGGTAWMFSWSEGWPDLLRIACRALSLAGSAAAFIGALRLAVLATGSLRFVLAQNLAALIVLELDDLRRATEEHAAMLGGAGGARLQQLDLDAWRPTGGLQIPRFFGDRKEIRKLLGPATEQTLEQVLASLQTYNQAVAEIRSQAVQDEDGRRNAALRLWHEIAVVQQRLKLAARELSPFCLAG